MSEPEPPRIRGAGTTKPPVQRVFVAQFVLLIVATLLAACYQTGLAVSLLLGGAMHLLPNIYFAKQVFRFSGASAAHRVTQSFYRGELGKFVLTATGFALVFALVKDLNPAAVFAAYGLMIVSHAVFVALIN